MSTTRDRLDQGSGTCTLRWTGTRATLKYTSPNQRRSRNGEINQYPWETEQDLERRRPTIQLPRMDPVAQEPRNQSKEDHNIPPTRQRDGRKVQPGYKKSDPGCLCGGTGPRGRSGEVCGRLPEHPPLGHRGETELPPV